MQRIKSITIFLLLLFISHINIHAQDAPISVIKVSDSDREILKQEKLLDFFIKNASKPNLVNQGMIQLYESGYLIANYEMIDSEAGKTLAIEVGNKYEWAHLGQGNLPDNILLKSGYKKSFFDQKTVKFRRISLLMKSIIRNAENNGYPFASIRLTEIQSSKYILEATINFKPGPGIQFDKVAINGDSFIKPEFLSAYLGIKPGMPYDERKVSRIPNLLNQLPYLKLVNPPLLKFSNSQCGLEMDLARRKASSFDGIIGFLPNYNEPDKLLITGQAYLQIQNMFKSGKELEIDWQKPNVLTQELAFKYNHPSLLRSPFDLSFQFLLFKQDSSFLNRNVNLGFQYSTLNFGKVGFQYENASSNLLSTQDIASDGTLYQADLKLNYYGITYLLSSLNNPFFPTRGFLVSLFFNIGKKEIVKNSALPEELYQGKDLNSVQVQSVIHLEKYLPINERQVVKTRAGAGLINNPNLFQNDLFRLGGINSMRGFNEKEIYASSYLTGSIEYRFLFENQSYLLSFIDGGYYQENTNNEIYEDFPIGIGGGMSIATKAGILNIIFALGKSKSQPFGFSNSKIHIGYSNRF